MDMVQATSINSSQSNPNVTRCGVVVIGKNEGKRLHRCFTSIRDADPDSIIVYVDSASTDDSVGIAESVDAEIVQLDTSTPITAARARNEGFQRLRQLIPEIHYVQFVDGDCVLETDWLTNAREFLDTQPDTAIVCGQLHEFDPNSSIYNRLCDIEWDRPVGETPACGGIFMIKAEQFERIGGFDPTIPAGEEPELCRRIREGGKKIVRLSEQMAQHDSAMTGFGQWWVRQIRTGYGGLDVANRFGGGLFASSVKSARVWGVGWPIITVLLVITGLLIAGVIGAVIGIGFAVAMMFLQICRITHKTTQRGFPFSLAFAHGALTMLSKWAHLWGQWRYLRQRAAGNQAVVIDHKQAANEGDTSNT